MAATITAVDYSSGSSIATVCASRKKNVLVMATGTLPRILPLLVVSTCAKRLHRHYSGQPAPLNRHYSVLLFLILRWCANRALSAYLLGGLTQTLHRKSVSGQVDAGLLAELPQEVLKDKKGEGAKKNAHPHTRRKEDKK